MSKKPGTIMQIRIDFPLPVEISDMWQRRLVSLVNEVCMHYEETHPTRVMWPFGVGMLAKYNPFAVDETHPQEYDDQVLHIEVSEREQYKVTESPSLATIEPRFREVLARLIPNSQLVRHWEIEDELVELFRTAFAIGQKDIQGRIAGQEMIRQLKETLARSESDNSVWLKILALKAGGTLTINPLDFQSYVRGSTLEVKRLFNGAVVMTYKGKQED